MKRSAFTALLTLMLLAFSCAQAQVSLEASAGYGGTVPGGRWFPLRVILTNEGEAFDGIVAVEMICNYSDYDRYEYPVHVEQGKTTVHMPVHLAAPERSLRVTLSDGESIVAENSAGVREMVDAYAYLIGVLGGNGALVSSLRSDAIADALLRKEQLTAVSLDDAMAAMTAKELDAFAALVIDAYDVGTLDDTQQEMLLDWLKDGGTVILGPGEKGCTSVAWFAEQTDVRYAETAEETAVLAALRDYTGAMRSEDAGLCPAYPLEAGEDGAAFDEQGRCVLACSRVNKGLVLSCGFGLSEGSVLEEARTNALWQRLLLAADADHYMEGFVRNNDSVFYVGGVCEQMLVSEGVSILPVAALLVGYVFIAGTGLFILMRRIDRTRLLWFVLPVCAAGALVIVAGLSDVLGLNEPTAASLRVIRYDEAGNVTDQEGVVVSWADDSRVRVEAEGASELVRTEYAGYSSTRSTDTYAHRDTLTLGEQPAIELRAAAPWTARQLTMTRKEKASSGAVTSRAYMEADGLHAMIENGTDKLLEDALLITSLGYATLGDIAPGEVREAVLATPERIDRIDGVQVIRDGELLEFPQSVWQVISAHINPPATGDAQPLSDREQRERSLLRNLFNVAVNIGDEFGCFVVARCPEMTCAQLYKDGEPITRWAQESIVSIRAAFAPVSGSGYFYYPAGTFEAQSVARTEKGYALSGLLNDRYQSLGSGLLIGYDLSGVEGHVECIRIQSECYGEHVTLSVYDHAAGDWVALNGTEAATIGAELIGRVVDERGQVVLRYTSEDGGDAIYNPTITVEGWKEENGHDRVQ